ncbi:MAG: hypothetical protein VKQ33_00375 [Candidatus Sericytochromatia bacterium]|nr:hypothetical protein [Candidatus Sericytochromatia bacterium]
MNRSGLLLIGALAAAGCTAANPASNGPTPPATPAAATPADPASAAGLARVYKAGRKWVHETTAGLAGALVTTTMSQEVTRIDGQKATLKVVVTAMGIPTESTTTVDLSQPSDGAVFSQSVAQGGTWSQSSVTRETVKVKAGEFATTRYAGTLKVPSGTSETTFWASDDVGLVKSVTKGSQGPDAYGLRQLPPGFQLPAGVTLPGLEGEASPAAPTTMTYESTMELVSVTP